MGQQATHRLAGVTSLSIVVTGTWGTGKSTIVERLGGEFQVVPEPARLALADDPSLRGDWQRFAETLLQRSIADHARAEGGITLFDRGVPDCVAYARWFGLEQSIFREAETRHRYHDEVLICPPWKDIYVNDDLRLATYEQARMFDEVLVTTYQELGYELVTIPNTEPDARVHFVRAFIAERTEVALDR